DDPAVQHRQGRDAHQADERRRRHLPGVVARAEPAGIRNHASPPEPERRDEPEGPGDADQHRPATTSVLVSTVLDVPRLRFAGVSCQLRPWKKGAGALICPKPAPLRPRLNSQAMPLLLPPPPSQPVRGAKRRLVVTAIAVALFFAGVATW